MNSSRKIPVEEKVAQHRDIIEESKKGNNTAQHKLYQLYAIAMYNTCFRMMNNKEVAEDMLQESFADAFRRLNSFRYESTFGAWLKQIVVNKCINEIKRKKIDLTYIENMHYFDNKSEEQEVNGSSLSVPNVKNAMEKLPAGSKMIFSLYLLEGYDHTEIAQILNITISTSKSQYMRARNKIKEILNLSNYEA